MRRLIACCGWLSLVAIAQTTEAETMTLELNTDNSEQFWVQSRTEWANDPVSRDDRMIVGGDPDNRFFSVLKFNLDQVPVDAKRVRLCFYAPRLTTACPSSVVKLYIIINGWASGAPAYPSFRGRQLTTYLGGTPEQWAIFDVTSLCRDWQSGRRPNFGLAFAPLQPEAWSSAAPRFTVWSSGRANLAAARPRLLIDLAMDETRPVFPLLGPGRCRAITSPFGEHWQNSYCVEDRKQNVRLLHTGTDFSAAAGEPVIAAWSGTVRYACTDWIWGGYLVTEQVGPDGQTFTITYEHVVPNPFLKAGSKVSRGQIIAEISNGGDRYVSHLHLQIRRAPYNLKWCLRGRLPEVACVAKWGESQEPPWPESFEDVGKISNWEEKNDIGK
jgi:murein DD-endopeptidase MepM/ murein hydrolase activator NlpD